MASCTPFCLLSELKSYTQSFTAYIHNTSSCQMLQLAIHMQHEMDQVMNWWYLVTKSSGPSQTLSSVTWVCMSKTGLPSCPRAKASAAPAYVNIALLDRVYSKLYMILTTLQNRCRPNTRYYGFVHEMHFMWYV